MAQEVRDKKQSRMDFSKIKEVLAMPDLIEIQKDSYKIFSGHGAARST